jgi:hypothetical protein
MPCRWAIMLCRVIRRSTLPGKVKGTYNSKLFMSSVKQQTLQGYKQLEICDIDNVKRKVCYVDIGSDTMNVPLVLLCGTAQTVNTFRLVFIQTNINVYK